MSEKQNNKIAEPDHTRGAQAVPRIPRPEPSPAETQTAPAPAPAAAPSSDNGE